MVRNFYLTIATESELFLVRPGNGDIPVYSPIDVNTTLHCVVNSAELEWEIDGLNFKSSINTHWLNVDRIYEGATTTSESGDTTYSSVIIFGDTNNGTMICCQVLQGLHVMKAYTVLIVYGMDIYSKR